MLRSQKNEIKKLIKTKTFWFLKRTDNRTNKTAHDCLIQSVYSDIWLGPDRQTIVINKLFKTNCQLEEVGKKWLEDLSMIKQSIKLIIAKSKHLFTNALK